MCWGGGRRTRRFLTGSPAAAAQSHPRSRRDEGGSHGALSLEKTTQQTAGELATTRGGRGGCPSPRRAAKGPPRCHLALTRRRPFCRWLWLGVNRNLVPQSKAGVAHRPQQTSRQSRCHGRSQENAGTDFCGRGGKSTSSFSSCPPGLGRRRTPDISCPARWPVQVSAGDCYPA